MDTDAHRSESDLTEAVIGSAFEVADVLGAGFLEKIYERAMIQELRLRGLAAKSQVSFPVCYKASGLRVALRINFQRPRLSGDPLLDQ